MLYNDFCSRCRNLSVVVAPDGTLINCPWLSCDDHPQPTKSQSIVADSARMFHKPNQHLFNLAIFLTDFTSDSPCPRSLLIMKFFSFLNNERAAIRRLHYSIEELRSDWLLPIGSRKDTPSGYWIIIDADDFNEWFVRTKSAPITQLSTIYRLAKRHFIQFTGQLKLELECLQNSNNQ